MIVVLSHLRKLYTSRTDVGPWLTLHTTPRTAPTYKPESVVCILFILGDVYGRLSRIGQAD